MANVFKATFSNSQLLQYCDSDNVASASALLQPLLDAIAAGDMSAKDELLVMLFVDSYDEDTPVEAALRVGLSRAKDSGNITMRLLILECLIACGPLERLAAVEDHPAHVTRLGKTLERQVLHYMARLGALMRPYATTSPPAGGEAGGEVINEPQMTFWLEKVLCELSHAEVGLCVANAFYAEYSEMRRVLCEFGGKHEQHDARHLLPRTFPNDVDRGSLGLALLTTLRLARDADTLADVHADSLRLYDAERLRELSARLQTAAAAALDSLGDDVAYLIVRHSRGQDAMRIAVLEGMREFLKRGAMQGAVRRLWLGEKLFALCDDPSLHGALNYLMWVCINVALLPIVAATPMIESARSADSGWGRVLGLRENYLLQVASFQAFSFQSIDLLLTLYLTFLPTAFPLAGLLWAASSLWFELVQLRHAMARERLSARVGGLGAYLVQDMFNWLDIPTLLLTVLSFGASVCWPSEVADAPAEGGIEFGARLLEESSEIADHAIRALRAGGGRHTVLSSSQHHTAILSNASQVDLPVSGEQFVDSVFALALLFMWFRQLRLLGLMSQTMRDLIQMLASMLTDVIKFMALFVVVLFAFAASLAHLISEDDVELSSPECYTVMLRMSNVFSSITLLFESALLGDVNEPLVCVRGAPSHHASMGVTLLFLFMIISILMLLNMIIAIMGQTFSDFFASASESSAVYFARIVQDWEDHTELPPLFNLFALPWHCFEALRTFVRHSLRSTGLVRPQLFAASTHTLARMGRLPDSPTAFAARPYKLLADDTAAASVESDGIGAFGMRKSKSLSPESFNFPEAPSLEEMKDAIAQTLQRRFGEWETTKELIDMAVITLMSDIHEIRQTMIEQAKSMGIQQHERKVRKQATVAFSLLDQAAEVRKKAGNAKDLLDQATSQANQAASKMFSFVTGGPQESNRTSNRAREEAPAAEAPTAAPSTATAGQSRDAAPGEYTA